MIGILIRAAIALGLGMLIYWQFKMIQTQDNELKAYRKAQEMQNEAICLYREVNSLLAEQNTLLRRRNNMLKHMQAQK